MNDYFIKLMRVNSIKELQDNFQSKFPAKIRLFKCRKRLEDLIRKRKSDMNMRKGGYEQFLCTLFRKIRNNLQFCISIVSTKQEAFREFECANDRGKHVKPFELMKNYLIMQVSDKYDMGLDDAIDDVFSSVESRLAIFGLEGDEDLFLRAFLNFFLDEAPVKKNYSIYGKFREHFKKRARKLREHLYTRDKAQKVIKKVKDEVVMLLRGVLVLVRIDICRYQAWICSVL